MGHLVVCVPILCMPHVLLPAAAHVCFLLFCVCVVCVFENLAVGV